MAGVELATAYVSLTISAKDVAPQVNKQFGAVEKEADKSGKAAGSKFSSGMGAAFKGIGGLFAGAMAGLAVKDFLGDALGEARESQKVGALTASVIKSTGGAAKVTEKQIGDLSSALSRKTGIDDEAIQTGSNLLLTFKNVRNEAGRGNDMFNQATAAALDLSKAGFGSVDGAAKMLGKALNDPIKGMSALGRAGVTFTEAQKKQVKALVEGGDVLGAQKIIMSEVQSQVGGAAEATATAGDKARVTFDNLKESAGTYLLPIVDKLATKFVALVEEFQSGVGAGGRFKEVIIQVKDGVMGVVDWFKRYSDILIPLGGAIVAIVAAMKVWSAITKAYVAIQTALNVVMSANPIGLVVLAIVGLVAALVLAYKKSETFRAIVDGAWKGVKAAISVVVDWFRNTAWPWMRDAFTWIGDKAKWLWMNIISPYFTAMKTLWSGVFGFLRDTVWPIARRAFEDIGNKGKWLWEDVLKPSFDAIKTGAGRVKDAFVAVKDGISRAWSNLKDVVSKPISAALGFINDKFVKPLNTLLEKVGVSFRIPTIGGGGSSSGRSTKGGLQMATGGVVPGHSPHDRADNIPAMLTAGEYVLPVPAVRRLSSRFGGGFLEQLRRGLPGYASGGLVDGIKSKASDAIDFASSAASLLRDPAKFLADMAGRLLGGIGSSPFAQIAGDVARKVASGLAAKIKDFLGGGEDVSGKPGGAMQWQAIWSMIKAVAPEARMTSNYRPGAMTASGFPSKHGMGRAVDLTSNNMMATFNKIRPLRAWTELYHSPAEGRQLLNGRSHIPQGITRQMHYNHIHAAMADGGLVKPLLFDRGGILPVGTSLVHNGTGAPEPLARMDGGVRLHPDDVNLLAAAIRSGASDGISGLAGRAMTHAPVGGY